jgi:hypothetical protein
MTMMTMMTVTVMRRPVSCGDSSGDGAGDVDALDEPCRAGPEGVMAGRVRRRSWRRRVLLSTAL